MQTEPERVGRDRRLDLLGVDSLMANELTVQIRQVIGCAVPTMEVASASNVTALAHRVLYGMGRGTVE
jgi:acyl carrier protein